MGKISDLTRQAILDHAIDVFAKCGFERAAVREITRRADVNAAAINYHFGGKEALYREVLRLAIAALNDAALLDEETISRVSRDEAVRLFIRQQVAPLLKHGQIGRYLRIFAWETVAPTPVYRDFIANEKLPMLEQAEAIVRRFLPPAASRTEIVIATIWLTQQVVPFIRHYGSLSQPPLSLTIDERFADELAASLGRMAVAGLSSHELRERDAKIDEARHVLPGLYPHPCP